MKKDNVSRAILAPEADGWRINMPGGATQSAKRWAGRRGRWARR